MLFSKVSVRFSLDRVMPRLGTHVVAVWVSDECIHETSEAGRWGGAQGPEPCPGCQPGMWAPELLLGEDLPDDEGLLHPKDLRLAPGFRANFSVHEPACR